MIENKKQLILNSLYIILVFLLIALIVSMTGNVLLNYSETKDRSLYMYCSKEWNSCSCSTDPTNLESSKFCKDFLKEYYGSLEIEQI